MLTTRRAFSSPHICPGRQLYADRVGMPGMSPVLAGPTRRPPARRLRTTRPEITKSPAVATAGLLTFRHRYIITSAVQFHQLPPLDLGPRAKVQALRWAVITFYSDLRNLPIETPAALILHTVVKLPGTLLRLDPPT